MNNPTNGPAGVPPAACRGRRGPAADADTPGSPEEAVHLLWGSRSPEAAAPLACAAVAAPPSPRRPDLIRSVGAAVCVLGKLQTIS